MGKRYLKTVNSNNNNINACTQLRCIIRKQNEIIQAQKEIITSMKLEKARLLNIKEFAQQELTRFLKINESRWIFYKFMPSKVQHLTNK